MIPKIIHYCWFGKGELPELAVTCMESWKRYCPDYKIVEWNEDNFDVTVNAYVQEAYEGKKWAFVTDFVRLYVLNRYGGVYMDTDVEICGNIDSFLENEAFSGFESDTKISTGLMGARAGNRWTELLLKDYEERHFKRKDGTFDTTTNVAVITRLTQENYAVQLNNEQQNLGDVTFYPSDFFSPKDCHTGKICRTSRTVAVHHFSASWIGKEEFELKEKKDRALEKWGPVLGKGLVHVYQGMFDIKYWGLKGFWGHLMRRIKSRRKN